MKGDIVQIVGAVADISGCLSVGVIGITIIVFVCVRNHHIHRGGAVREEQDKGLGTVSRVAILIIGVPGGVDLVAGIVKRCQAGIDGLLFEVLHGHVEAFSQRGPVPHGLIFYVGVKVGNGWVAHAVLDVTTVVTVTGAVAEKLQTPVGLVSHFLHDAGDVAVLEVPSLIRK